jgi:hypothetical protein
LLGEDLDESLVLLLEGVGSHVLQVDHSDDPRTDLQWDVQLGECSDVRLHVVRVEAGVVNELCGTGLHRPDGDAPAI